MSYDLIRVEDRFDGQVSELRLCAPPGNILSARMMDEISRYLKVVEQDARKKLIVISGEGQHFSFGASVEEHAPDKVSAMLRGFHHLIGQVIECKVPTLAKVSGLCLGGGFELALACTFIMSDEGAKFAVPEIQLGVFPPAAAALLPSLCGGHFAAQMILTGEKLGARVLQQAGLVAQVVEAGGLEAATAGFIEKQILPRSASSLRFAHRASRMTVAEIYRAAIAKLEKLYLEDLMQTKDAVEGICSFIEKRAPKWTNA